jgi:hypothetical protein
MLKKLYIYFFIVCIVSAGIAAAVYFGVSKARNQSTFSGTAEQKEINNLIAQFEVQMEALSPLERSRLQSVPAYEQIPRASGSSLGVRSQIYQTTFATPWGVPRYEVNPNAPVEEAVAIYSNGERVLVREFANESQLEQVQRAFGPEVSAKLQLKLKKESNQDFALISYLLETTPDMLKRAETLAEAEARATALVLKVGQEYTGALSILRGDGFNAIRSVEAQITIYDIFFADGRRTNVIMRNSVDAATQLSIISSVRMN